MSINQAVQDAIKQNLPSVVAEELSVFIEQAARDKKVLEEHKEVVRKLSLSTVELAETNKGLEGKLSAYKDLEKREREVEKREQALELTLCKGDLTNAVRRAEMVERLAEIAFKNPRIIHSESSSTSTPNASGYSVMTTSGTQRTIEETK